MTDRPWLVVVNPAAGSTVARLDDVRSAFSHHDVPATITVTRSVDHLRDVVRAGVASGHRNIAVVGGDGTAHHVLNAMMATATPNDSVRTLSIIPAGSGSDFIRTFGHSRGLEEGVARLRTPDRYRIDVGRAVGAFGTAYFLNAVNVGIAASAASRALHLPRRLGPRRYAIGFWIALARFSQAAIDVRTDDHRFTGTAINVVVANGQFFGGGMNIAPRATLTDGRFDVQVFLGPRRKAFSVMPRVVRGSPLTHTSVRRYIGADIRITVPDAWAVEADGEILGTGSVHIATIPSAIDFVI